MATSRRPQRSSTIPVHGTPFAGPTAVSWSPPTGARGSSTLAHPRSPTMTSPITPVHIITSSFNVGSSQDSPAPFEPRIIRGSSSRATYDPTSRSPPAARGPARATSARRPSQGSTARRPSLVHPTLPSRPTPSTDSEPSVFPRPVYLEHSVLRDFLQTDQPRPSTSASATSIQLSRSPVPSTPDPRSTFADPIPRHVRLAREDTPATDSDDDSVFSVVQRPVATALPTPSVSIMSSGNPVLRLPTRWSEQDRHPSLSVSQNGRELTYRGPPSHHEKDAAAARTNHPIPPACGIYYYEIEVLQRGVKGFISIGFSAGDVRLARLPGWEKRSWGYHGDDGNSFAAEKTGQPYGPTFGTGDVVGCGIDFCQNRAFYTKNGVLLPFAFDGIGRECELYPSVGLRHADESIRANFGHQPFRYDIDGHAHQQREAVWSTILDTPLSLDTPQLVRAARLPTITCADGLLSVPKQELGHVPEKDREARDEEMATLRPALDALVLGYLTHHGYSGTAKALRDRIATRAKATEAATDADTEMKLVSAVPKEIHPPTSDSPGLGSGTVAVDSTTMEDEMEKRAAIVRDVLSGDAAGALANLELHFPQALATDQGLLRLKLRCADFVAISLQLAEMYTDVQKGRDTTIASEDGNGLSNGAGAMDVDDDSPSPGPDAESMGKTSVHHITRAEYDRAVADAIAYGRKLQAEHKKDTRPEVRILLGRTFGVLAFNDPRAALGESGTTITPDARAVLAGEVNTAILQSQGRHARPALERAYSQAQACVAQLGLMGIGAAAYADIRRELLE